MTTDAGQHPDTGTAVLITNSRGEYLLHLRDDIPGICWPGCWALVGGRPEPGESLSDAIARELKEETGLDLPLEEFVTVQQEDAGPLDKSAIKVFRTHWDGDAHALPVTEGIMFHWFPAAALSRLRVPPWCREAVRLDRGK